MALARLDLEHVPPEYRVYAAFFRDVANTEFLYAQLLSRNGDFEYAFVDASSVASRLHLLTAIYNALNILIDGTLRTPNVHSEIVVSLSTNNNVLSALSLCAFKILFCPAALTLPPIPPDCRCLPEVGHHAQQDQRLDRSQSRLSTFRPGSSSPDSGQHLGSPNKTHRGHTDALHGLRAIPHHRLAKGAQILSSQRCAGAGKTGQRGGAPETDGTVGYHGHGVERSLMGREAHGVKFGMDEVGLT